MKKIDESAISSSIGLYVEAKTVQHLQDSYAEIIKAVQNFIPDAALTGKLVILSGCVATGSNPGSRTLSAGVVYKDGEIFQVPSAAFTTSGLEIGVWKLTDVNAGTNESTLTDNTNVHALLDRKFVFLAGLAGSGDFDETSTNIVRLTKKVRIPLGSWDMDATSSINTSLGSFVPDYTKIVGAECIVYRDNGDPFKLEYVDSTSSFALAGAIGVMNTSVDLSRKTGGFFDSVDFNDTSINRGYLTITYIV